MAESISSPLLMAIGLVLAGGLLAIGVALVRQNRPLWRRIAASERPLPRLLPAAFVLWSPLALVIVVLACAAAWLGSAAVSASYRLTTLDEFCRTEGGVVLPCTGLGKALDGERIQPAGVQADLDRHLSERYRVARRRLLSLSDRERQDLVANLPAFLRAWSPAGVLGLEPAPEDDHELVRLKRELRTVLETPTPPARNVLDVVRHVTERDARVQRLRELTARVLARREQVHQAAYAGLPSADQGRLWLRHRLAHLLSRVDARPQAASAEALALVLARNEAAAAEILQRETASSKGTAALYIALGMRRLCSVATPDAALRRRAADFEAGPDRLQPGDLLQSNAGSFACPTQEGGREALALESLGFRESVRRSIERWHAESLQDSGRRLGRLALQATDAQGDAAGLAREAAQAIPSTLALGRGDCGWLKPIDCAMNALRESIEDGYARASERLAEATQSRAEAAMATAAGGVEQRLGRSLATLDGRLEAMRIAAHEYAARFFLAGDLLRLFGWLALLLIAVKSFLYVLALELFHSDGEMTVAFEGAAPVEGDYRTGRQLTIDREFPYAMITRKQLSNTDNDVRFAPWPGAAPLARILRGRYFFFTRGSFLADDAPSGTHQAIGMVASAGGGQSVVEWRMLPGEEVIFRYRDFFGASENVRLESELSLRLSTLLLGRIVFHRAHCLDGPGRLLLKAYVEEIAQEEVRAVPPERLIAWNRHARFSIHSARTPWKTLLNGYTLVRRAAPDGASGRILVSSEDAGSNLGSIRYVRRIFSAIF